MFLARRAIGPARTLARRQQPRRLNSSSAGHGGEHHHAEPVNESLGRGFYISVACVPVTLALYKYATSDSTQKPWVTQLIEKYSEKESAVERRNALHSAAVHRAAEDRHLFQSQDDEPLTIDLAFPEIFNVGSPINVPAGHGFADLRPVKAHYDQKLREAEKERRSRLKDGKVVSVYDDGRYF